MNGRSLRASINQTPVGTLQEVGGLWSFQYATDWPNGSAWMCPMCIVATCHHLCT